MARSSWCTRALVLALLFVTSDCLRGPGTNAEGSASTTIRTRGGSRFISKVEEKRETTPLPFSSQSRSIRRGGTRTAVTASSGRIDEKKTEITTLRNRRDRDRNVEVIKNGKVSGEIPVNLSGRRESSGNLNPRRQASLSRQASEHEGDLANAASSDRRYLPETRERRGRKFEEEAKLELPNETSRVTSRGQRGSSRSRNGNEGGRNVATSSSALETTTQKPRTRSTRKVQALPSRDANESKKSSRRFTEQKSQKPNHISTEAFAPRNSGRRITERSTKKHDIASSNFDGLIEGNSPTALPNITRRGSSRFSSSRETTTETISRTATPPKLRSHTRRSEPASRKSDNSSSVQSSRKSTSKDKTEKRSKSIEKSEPLKSRASRLGNNSRGITRGNNDRRASSRTLETKRETITQSSQAPEVITPASGPDDSTISFTASGTLATSTHVPAPTSSVSGLSSSSSISSKRRQAPSTTTLKPPKEDFFNNGLGFRGRKYQTTPPPTTVTPPANPTKGNDGWILHRRPNQRENNEATPSTISNEISKNSKKPTGQTPRRQKIATAIFKVDKEIALDDNYPPEFKAKLAQLNRSDQHTPGSGIGKVNEDPMMTVKRHLRSIDQPNMDSVFPDNDTFPEIVSPFPVLTTPLVDYLEMIDGSKKRQSSIAISVKSKEKLENARKLIKPELKSEEINDVDDKSITAPSSSGRTISRSMTTELPSTNSAEVQRSSRRSSGSRIITTTPKDTTISPSVKTYTRTSKSVQRSNVRVTETMKIRKARIEKSSTTEKPEDNELIQTTQSYIPEVTSEEVKTQTVKSWILSSRGRTSTNNSSIPTRKSRAWNTAYIDKNWEDSTTNSPVRSESVTHILKIPRTTKRPRHWNAAYIDKNWQDPSERTEKSVVQTTPEPVSNSKYSRMRADSYKSSGPSIVTTTTEKPVQPLKRREYRPRTSTYRRHSEPIPSPSTEKDELESVAITPKQPKYSASIKSTNSSQRSARQEPAISLAVANATASNESANSTGISLSNRGSSGSNGGSNSNIFNPTKTTYLINSNASLLEQLRSTVAPLLSALGTKTPIFSGAYSTVSTSNSGQRVTPSGSPPRFSARYRGAELFVRKPSGLDSSGPTTPITPEDTGPSPQISISSPGEPKVITFYQALESASITNEVEQTSDNIQQSQLNNVAQVVTNNDANVPNNSNNDTTTAIETSVVPVTTVDSLTTVDDTQAPEITTTIITSTTTTRPDTTQSPDVIIILPETTEMTRETTTFEPSLYSTTPIVETTVTLTGSTEIDVNTVEESLSTTDMNNEVSEVTEAMATTTEVSSTTITNPISEENVISVTEKPIKIVMGSLISTTTDASETTTEMDNSIFEASTETATTEITTIATSAETSSVEPTTEAMLTTPEISSVEPTTETMLTTQETVETSAVETTTETMLTTPEIVELTSVAPATEAMLSTTEPSEPFSVEPATEAMLTTPRIAESSSVEATTEAMLTTPETTGSSSVELTTETMLTTSEAAESSPTEPTTGTMLTTSEAAESSSNELTTETMLTTSEAVEQSSIAPTTETISNTPETAKPSSEVPEAATTVDESTTANQVMDGNQNLLTTTATSSTESSTLEAETTLTPITTTSSDFNSTEVDNGTATPDINEEILNQMMQRLMSLFNIDSGTSQSRNLEGASSKSDDITQMLGGFLDHTDRNLTIEVETLGQTNNTVENTTPEALMENTVIPQSSEMSIVPDINITLVSESETIATTTFEPSDLPIITTELPVSMTMSINESSSSLPGNTNSILTTSEQLTTTLNPETTEIPTTKFTEELTTSITTPSGDPDESNSTTMTPETLPTTVDPNLLAGFQDRTPATAQRTAGADVQSPTESQTTTPNIPTDPTTTPPSSSSTVQSESATIEAVNSVIPVTTETVISQTTEPAPSTTMMPMSDSTTTTSPPTTTTSPPTTTTSPPTTTTTPPPSPTATTTQEPTTAYSGRFGASRLTPAPRFSSSTSTLTPLRDYHVYGIYPNKTIVRKRPEDNLIDARNIDSPYVIFGIYPDGRLVRKYPNGTVIPDPPSQPVEVVFSLSTTTTTTTTSTLTNRLNPVQLMSNQGTNINNNQNILLNNPIMDNLMSLPGVNGMRSQLNLGLSGNAITINGDGPNQSEGPTLLPGVGNVGNQPTSNKMSDFLLNTKMGTSANVSNEIVGLLTTGGPPSSATPSSVNPQGGRIIQESERDKASRTSEAGGQRSTVYIGQEKFINYWNDDSSNNNNSRVVSVKINSVTTAMNEAPVSSSGMLPPLDIISKDQVTAPPGFPWKDPLDQIFGITTESPMIRASVASNTIDEQSPSRFPITERPINRLNEVFTPMLNDAQLARDTSITTTTVEPSVSTTSSTTSTTTLAATTSTATTRPTTISTTTTLPSTMPVTIISTSTPSTTTSFSTVNNQQQSPFGATFDDIAFLNSLLQTNSQINPINSTPKTLTDVERLLANRILSLAIGKPGPTRSPKAIQPSNISPNSLELFPTTGSNSQPIIIDLLQTTSRTTKPSTTSAPVTWKPVALSKPIATIPNSTAKPATTEKIASTVNSSTSSTSSTSSITATTPWTFPTHPPTVKATTTTTTTTTTTAAPPPTTTTPKIIVTRKPSPKPRPTQPPLGFGANILRAIFGRDIFTPTTTQKPIIIRRPVQTTVKPVQTTAKPTVTTTTKTTTTTTTTVPPKTSTFSPADDAKFLLNLLNAANKDKTSSGQLSGDDETFLRSILNGQAKIKLPEPGSTPTNEAALLAALLKAQGIEPSTPVNNIRDQLNALSNGASTTNSPKKLTTRRITTTRPRPSLTSTYPPPLFSNFNFGNERPRGQSADDGDGVRNQILNAAIGATRVFSQFLGAAITGAAQQLQSFVKNGTRIVSEVVG